MDRIDILFEYGDYDYLLFIIDFVMLAILKSTINS